MSTAALPVHVGLVDLTGEVGDLAGLAAALSEQVGGEFYDAWKVRAAVGAYTKDSLPSGCWSVQVQAKLDDPSALGYHTDVSHQPYALVEFTHGVDQTVSHEVLEMLADPWGSRLHTAGLPDDLRSRYKDFGLLSEHSRVRYLLEVCDPCEATGYEVGGRVLSDFLLPSWYRTTPVSGGGYSHAGGCAGPREVSPGGYVSFEAPSGEWFQAFNDGGGLSVQSLGHLSGASRSLREWTDAHARAFRRRTR